MAGKKKAVPRQSRTAETRAEKAAVPRWKVLADGRDRTILEAGQFRNPDGSWKTSELYRANKLYGNKTYGLELEGEAVTFRPKHIYVNPQGGIPKDKHDLLIGWNSAKGKKGDFYEVPLSDPGEGNWIEKEKRSEKRKAAIKRLTKAAKSKPQTVREYTNHPEIPHVRVRKTYVTTNGVKTLTEEKLVGSAPRQISTKTRHFNDRVFKTVGEARLYSGEQKVKEMERRAKDPKTDPVEKAMLERQLRDIKSENAALRRKPGRAPKTAKAVVPKQPRTPATKAGAKYKPDMRLAPSQYVTAVGYVQSISARRRAVMEIVAANRKVRARKAETKRQAQQEYRAAIRASKHAKAVEKRRLKEQLRQPIRRAAAAARVQTKLVRQIKGFQQFAGRGPLPLQLKGKQWAKGRTFNRALKSLPHAERYPAVGHSGPSPMRPPVSMAPVSGAMTLDAAKHGLRSRVAGTKVYATTQTVQGRGGSGRGVFFRINADAVLANLTQRYPQAMAAAAIGAAKTIGNKLLDIVEPYVPKDTGLMYTTAQTNSDQTGGGLVDIDGAEAYPASQMFGVSISYNTPYAEDVYFDMHKAHGAAYNDKHGTSEKGEKETARWIEAAFKQDAASVQGLIGEYAQIVTASLETAGLHSVGFKTKSGASVNFVAKRR